jgi:hypothetical protein
VCEHNSAKRLYSHFGEQGRTSKRRIEDRRQNPNLFCTDRRKIRHRAGFIRGLTGPRCGVKGCATRLSGNTRNREVQKRSHRTLFKARPALFFGAVNFALSYGEEFDSFHSDGNRHEIKRSERSTTVITAFIPNRRQSSPILH